MVPPNRQVRFGASAPPEGDALRSPMAIRQSTEQIHAAQCESVNYCHYSDSLVELRRFASHFAGLRSVGKRATAAYFDGQKLSEARRSVLLDVLSFMSGPQGQHYSFAKLGRALNEGWCWRHRFQVLGCRGFSFRRCDDPRFPLSFGRDITLKVALLTDPGLYYPPPVRRALHRQLEKPCRHISGAIGWLVGRERRVNDQTWWYVINVQSDLMSQGSSCLRDLFRGWQRVLFWIVLGLAYSRGVTMIALPPADALADSSALGNAGGRRLDAWRPLYDGVASFFAMSRIEVPQPINVQPMLFLPETWCSTFYAGEVARMLERFENPTSTGTVAHSWEERVRKGNPGL
jgi:hypothetical protein